MSSADRLPDIDLAEVHRQTVHDHSTYMPTLERRLTAIKQMADTLYALGQVEDTPSESLYLIGDALSEHVDAIWLALAEYNGEPANAFMLDCPTRYRSTPTLEDVSEPANGGDNA